MLIVLERPQSSSWLFLSLMVHAGYLCVAIIHRTQDMDYRIFIMCTDVNACDCTPGGVGGGGMYTKRVCTESWLWEENLLPHQGTCISGVIVWCSSQLNYIPHQVGVATVAYLIIHFRISCREMKISHTISFTEWNKAALSLFLFHQLYWFSFPFFFLDSFPTKEFWPPMWHSFPRRSWGCAQLNGNIHFENIAPNENAWEVGNLCISMPLAFGWLDVKLTSHYALF